MPFIKVEAGKMNRETKEKLIIELTRAASESLGISKEAFTILIKENETDNWGLGGKVLTNVLAERAKKPFVNGLHLANRLVYACRSIWA